MSRCDLLAMHKTYNDLHKLTLTSNIWKNVRKFQIQSKIIQENSVFNYYLIPCDMSIS